jgi:hypothetical protein
MSFNIWFVPTNSSHIGKNVDLLRRIREAGHHVKIICSDNLLEPMHGTLEQIKKLDFDYEIIPSGNFRMTAPPPISAIRVARSLYRSLQEHKFYSITREFLLDRRERPDTLIFGTEVDPLERCFIKTANSLGIPSILITDGIYPLWNPDYNPGFFKGIYERWEKRISHLLHGIGPKGTSGIGLALVINETSKKFLEQNGLPSAKIHVVGAPEYVALAERLGKLNTGDYINIRRRVGILSDRPVVLFAHQPAAEQEVMQRMILAMVEGCRRSGAVLLVKFHPRSMDYPDAWRGWAKREGLNQDDVVFLRDECTSQDAVIICTALITIFSTVALEALTCRRPMLLIKFLNTDRIMTYAQDYGIALDVDREEDLAQTIVSILSDEKLRKRLLDNYPLAIQKELNDLDGGIVEIISHKIECFLEKRCIHSHVN